MSVRGSRRPSWRTELGLTRDTIAKWEAGHRVPSGPARWALRRILRRTKSSAGPGRRAEDLKAIQTMADQIAYAPWRSSA